MTRPLLAAAALALAASACFPDPEGVCRTQADCKDGTTCTIAEGATRGLCLANTTITCDLNCGAGFTCRVAPSGAQECKLADGQTASVTVTRPAASQAVRAGPLALECTASGPQLGAATFHVTQPGGTPKEIAATRPDASGPFVASYEVPADADGLYAIDCAATFGPAEHALVITSPVISVAVDATPPVIASTSPADWFTREGTATVRATITDTGTAASGVASASLVLGAFSVSGVPGSGGEYTFAIDLSQVGSATTAGELAYELRALDFAGNMAAPVAGALRLDATAPLLAWTPDPAWHARDRAVTISVSADMEASGAPMTTATLTRDDGSEPTLGTISGANITFEIDPARYLPAGTEAEVALRLTVLDAAGNANYADGFVRLDDRGPQLVITADSQWKSRGSQVPVTVTVSDASGVAPASVRVEGSAQPCTAGADGSYTCTVSTAAAAANAETPALPFTISATDLTGHSSSAAGSLKVDNLAPVLTLAVDGKWYARGASIPVRGTATDSGALIAAGAVPSLEVSVDGSLVRTVSGTYDVSDGSISFSVPGDVAPAGATTSTIEVKALIADAVNNTGNTTRAGQLRIDDQAPTVANVTVKYSGVTGFTTKLLRRDPANLGRNEGAVCANVSDPSSGSGLATGGVVLFYTGLNGTDSEIQASATLDSRCVGFTHSFPLDARTMKFSGTKNNGATFAAEDNIGVRVRADDAVANRTTSAGVQASITRKLWERTLTAGARVIGSPAVTGDTVYASLSVGIGGISNLFAINKTTGLDRWSAVVSGTPTTPVTVGSDKLYVASDAAGGTLNAFTVAQAGSTASPAWGCAGYGVARGALALATFNWQTTPSETIFYPSNEPNLYALRRNASNTDCDLKVSPAGGLDISSSAVSHGNGVVHIGSTTGRIARIDLLGTAALFSSTVSTTATPSGFGQFNIPGVPLDSAALPFYVHPNFAAKLSSSLTETYRGTSANFTQAATQAVLGSDTTVFFGSSVGSVFGFSTASTSPTFEYLVRTAAGAAKAVASTPVVGQKVDGATTTQTLYFTGNDSKFRAISTSGTDLWFLTLSGDLESSPALDCNGVAYFGTNAGAVVALVTDSDGLANSSWPKYQHDNRNTGSLTTVIRTAGGACVD
jgi:hypothetical protein